MGQQITPAPNSSQAPLQRFRFIPANKLTGSFPEIRWLIRNKFPAQGSMVVFGATGVYKTFYLLSEALEISQQGKVIYFYSEAVEDADVRIQALSNWTGLDCSNLLICPTQMDVSKAADVNQLISELGAAGHADIRMIVFDTLAENFGDGDEDKARDMRRYNRGIRHLRDKFQCLVASVHHTGHSETGRARGSSALKGAVDVMIRVSRGEGKTVKVACAKMRIADKFPEETWTINPYLNSVVLEKRGAVNSRALRILKRLTQGDMRHGQIHRATGIPGATLTRLLQRLVSDGYISHGRDETYHLLKEGVAVAGHASTYPCSTTSTTETDSGTTPEAETDNEFHPVEQNAAGANGHSDKELTDVLFHVPVIETESVEDGTHSVPLNPPPYKGEVEQMEEEKAEGAGQIELDSSPLLGWGWTQEQVAKMSADEVKQVLATFTV